MKDDLLTGLKEIAEYLGFDEEKTGRLHRQKLIPTFTVQRTIYARKSQIDEVWRHTDVAVKEAA